MCTTFYSAQLLRWFAIIVAQEFNSENKKFFLRVIGDLSQICPEPSKLYKPNPISMQVAVAKLATMIRIMFFWI